MVRTYGQAYSAQYSERAQPLRAASYFFAHIGPRAVAAPPPPQRNARPESDTGTRETGRWGNCHGVLLVDAESQKTAETSGAKATPPFALDTRDRLVYVRALP